MVRVKEVQDKLLHLVGWMQNYNTSDFKISDELTVSESGLYFQQVHPLLTLHNLKSIAPDFKNTEYDSYKADTQYYKGNIVFFGDKLYKAQKDIKSIEPGTDAESWNEVDPFSDWLLHKTKEGIWGAISRFIMEKTASSTFKALCENKVLFNNAGRISDTVINRNNLVGFEIVPIRSKGVTAVIDKIGLQFTKPGDYTLYLMHSSSYEPVKVIKLTKTKENTMEWFIPGEILCLPFMSESTDAGGSWYLCYKQSELPEGSMAIRKDKDWSKSPCRACSQSEYISWQAWSKYLEIHPFSVDEKLLESTGSLVMWDIENNNYTYGNNYGINLEVTVQCDISDFIIEQRALFANVIAKQVAVNFLREFVYNANTRTNRNSINASRADILYELDGDSASMKKSGLCYQLDMAFDAIKLATTDIDRVCLPCNNHGIKYKTI